jgi:cytochrome c-type biogenesis protein CcmH/NrfG
MPTALKSDPQARRFSLGLAHGIFVLVLGVRLAALLQLTHSPLLIPSRGDMHFYDDWARQILHGQMTEHLAFYGLPGYAYLLAGLYRLLGENPFVPGFIQALIDAGTAVLIYRISIDILARFGSTSDQSRPAHSSLHPRTIGLLGALGWAFFVPAQTYSIVLMPTAWFVFAFWFAVWRLVRTGEALRAAECFCLGLLIGLSATAVATILIVLPLIFAAIILRSQSNMRAVLGKTGLAFAGVVIGTSPCWIHNYCLARDPVFLSAHSGINFWIGNNPQATGYPRFPPGLRAGQAAMLQDSIEQAETAAGRPLKRAEVSNYWSKQAGNYIATDSGDWLRLLARKLRNFWSAFQYDDLSIVTVLREQNITFPGLYFGVVAALALPGIFLGWWFARQSRWILGAILLSMIAILAIFITERYRLVAVPGLVVFAALGLSIFRDSIVRKQLRVVAFYLVLLVGSTTAVAWPHRDPSLWALDAYNSGWQALESGNLVLAEQKLALAYAYVPDNSETLFALGNLRLAENDAVSAQSFYRAVLAFDPKHKGAFNNLGVIALDASEFDTAENWFRRAEDVDPRNAKTHFLLAKSLLGKNDRSSAQNEIDAAISLKPDQPEFKALKQQIEKE